MQLELFQRVFSSFIDGEYANFIYENLKNVAKQDTIKKNFKEMKALGIIEDFTTNGYATKIKIANPLECPDFLFDARFNIQTKDYILSKWHEYNKFGRLRTVNPTRERIIKEKGATTLDLVKNAKFIKNSIHTDSDAVIIQNEFGYRIVAKTQPYHCIYCGDEDPSHFHTGNKSICKECGAAQQREKYTLAERLFQRSAKSARTRGIEYDLDPDFLDELLEKQDYKCCYSGVKFGDSFTDKMTYPTVDRIDSSKGYFKDNVCLCSNLCNIMKHDLSVDQFKDLITKIYNNKDNF